MRFNSSALGNFASMICGDFPFNHFPYRTSAKLTSFFHYLNLDYSHDGSTRKYWVESVLSDLNNNGDKDSPLPYKSIETVLMSLLHPENFLFVDGVNREQAIQDVNSILSIYNLEAREQGANGQIQLVAAIPETISIDEIKGAQQVFQSLDNNSKGVRASMSIKKIFISHSSEDVDVVTELVNLLENMGVNSHQIFCSSLDGYGIPLGENFLDRIKNELNDEVMVLFLLTESFFKSPICMCEMGATWVQAKHHIPIVVPPFVFNDIRGVIQLSQGIKINESGNLNNLLTEICDKFQLQQPAFNTWERKRNRFIEDITRYITQKTID
ncbi:toll/interleukin-1 receptor domain-containing protein [Peribacillus butanolivorans]|uniref:toll/interleukin-1 receptor domain-containing protein n=1 Tax=Peribacillus butanolivorans TaxID=421767 RepID=UPI00207C7127|nr:toll/interleukin-1 receptor domain-containing protein [Peribacillus butanolivorans]MCO0597261.1 toll/interleukin-1 receptor domain-containing protein [Peribacillus butanolivorans]